MSIVTLQDYFSISIDEANVISTINTLATPFYLVDVSAGLGQISAKVLYRCLTWVILPGPCGSDPSVSSGTGYNMDSILEENNEYVEGNYYNAWVAGRGQTGDNAMIEIDLGCDKIINGFYLRNFHSGTNWQDGTNQFNITFCSSASFSPGAPACQDRTFNLERISSKQTEKTVFFPLEIAVSVRLVTIRIQSFYGKRGGLQYFRENEISNPGSSYQGRNKYKLIKLQIIDIIGKSFNILVVSFF